MISRLFLGHLRYKNLATMDQFLAGDRIQELVREAEAIQRSGRAFSDTIDNEGRQYVDLVQEGGGVLGIGLVGYTYILEKAGIRFYSLAGTSAGSINTLLIASLAEVGEAVSPKILKALSEQDLFEFVDGPKSIKKLIQKQIDGEKGLVKALVWNSLKIFRLLKNKLGLNPGQTFEDWLKGLLHEAGIESMADLLDHRERRPALKLREDRDGVPSDPRLAVVTSEINTHTKVDFPRMASLYWKQPESVSPAAFVRASMSIPYFFFPFFIKGDIPDAGVRHHPEWKRLAGYHGPVPPEVRFVDGGMLSNFPINIFHAEDSIPTRPTFGVRLSTYRNSYSDTSSFFGLSGAMISTMRQTHDYDFILRNPDYRKLICNIDADQEFNWLNFNMSRERQIALFTLGAEKGLEFLKQFNWQEYKDLRASLL